MAELYIGTCGYDYPDWKGENLFYPKTVSRKNFLSYYATQFNSLELNGTFYNMPTAAQMQNMITRTDGKIKFTVKAFQDITHGKEKFRFIPSTDYLKLAYAFKKALEPLQKDNLLLCALFQFPQCFYYDEVGKQYLNNLLKELKDIPVVVEMRNIAWQKEQVYNALRQRKVGWCITDNPALKDLPKLEYMITNDIAYIRFHGRNKEMWYKGDNVTRYDYFYSDNELRTFVEPIKHLLKNTHIVQLFFNNHAKAQAVVNAKKLELLLKSGD
jgi:uncharacterized protein YecE (DUF72 family)